MLGPGVYHEGGRFSVNFFFSKAEIKYRLACFLEIYVKIVYNIHIDTFLFNRCRLGIEKPWPVTKAFYFVFYLPINQPAFVIVCQMNASMVDSTLALILALISILAQVRPVFSAVCIGPLLTTDA
jgi:hypothetical protein